MNIRRAFFEQDHWAISVLGYEEYVEEKVYSLGVNFNALAMMRFQKLMADENRGFSFVAETDDKEIVGFIHCLYTPIMNMDPTSVCCLEVGWYMSRKYRGQGLGFQLLKAAEEEAAKNVTLFKLSVAVTTDNYEALLASYRKREYVPFEVTCIKSLSNEGGSI